MVNKTCTSASHDTGKMSRRRRYPFSIVFETLSREVNRHGQSDFTIRLSTSSISLSLHILKK